MSACAALCFARTAQRTAACYRDGPCCHLFSGSTRSGCGQGQQARDALPDSVGGAFQVRALRVAICILQHLVANDPEPNRNGLLQRCRGSWRRTIQGRRCARQRYRVPAFAPRVHGHHGSDLDKIHRQVAILCLKSPDRRAALWARHLKVHVVEHSHVRHRPSELVPTCNAIPADPTAADGYGALGVGGSSGSIAWQGNGVFAHRSSP